MSASAKCVFHAQTELGAINKERLSPAATGCATSVTRFDRKWCLFGVKRLHVLHHPTRARESRWEIFRRRTTQAATNHCCCFTSAAVSASDSPQPLICGRSRVYAGRAAGALHAAVHVEEQEARRNCLSFSPLSTDAVFRN